jgi:hypothetical protein
VIDERWKLDELEPDDKLDRRVRRRMRMFTSRSSARRAAPFLPFERAIYAVVLAVYALYTGARAIRVLQESRAGELLAATSELSRRERSPRPCEPASSLFWRRPRWWS